MATTNRDHFIDTIWERDEDSGAALPLNNIQVSVFRLDDNGNRLTVGASPIYAGRIGATQRSNPFTTDISGLADFWAEAGEHEVEFVDLTIPARITPTTIGWNSTPGAKNGIPGDRIGKDGGLDLAAFAPNAMRQVKQLGEVWQWWRPASDIAIPTDSEPCDGRVVTQDNHDFGGSVAASSITLPDLRNKFMIGTEVPGIAGYPGDGAAGVDGTDTATDAPGIGRVGGSNFRNLAHTHTVNAHSHTVNAHSHTVNAHAHSIETPIGMESGWATVIVPSQVSGAFWAGQTNKLRTSMRDISTQGTLATEIWRIWTDNASPGTDAQSPGTNSQSPLTDSKLLSAQDVKPRYVGLLMLMKVRYS